jgi:hypothetical protein
MAATVPPTNGSATAINPVFSDDDEGPAVRPVANGSAVGSAAASSASGGAGGASSTGLPADWKSNALFASFAGNDFDEAAFVGRVMAASASTAHQLKQLSAGISALQGHIRSVVVANHTDLLNGIARVAAIEHKAAGIAQHVNTLSLTCNR